MIGLPIQLRSYELINLKNAIGQNLPKDREIISSSDRVKWIEGGDRYSRKAMPNGGNTMFYIHILNQPPHGKSTSSIPDSTVKTDQKLMSQLHRKQIREIHQKARKNY